ncbi:arylsulfotransferase family protein [Jannaschia marina]|uniref:arylsulfotransferase family protein n=1 Tax=Jannaschia marina TaxID=2741674 RepID=UPI0015CC5751|nr:arylsulfotransferase family protein [Jannaschia marina]
MKSQTLDRLARGAFIASLVVIASVYGVVSSWWGWFPAPQIGEAHRTFVDLRQNWRNDIGLEPTRHLVPPNGPSAGNPDRGYERRTGTERAPGYILIAGLSDDQDTSVFAVRLMDAEGNEVHRWPINYENFDPDTPPQNVMLHGMEVFEDGSLVVTFDVGNAIARVDQCGETMWSVRGGFHHSISRDGAGGIWTWLGEDMVRLDAATGEQTFGMNLREDVIAADDGDQRAIFDIRVRMPDEADGNISYLNDPFHPNDVEMLRPSMADAFPMFEAGDLMFSLREPNLVAVVDPETGVLKWWRHGPWFKQHDPDFEPDGTITVFDNATVFDHATGPKRSRILRTDPQDDSVTMDFTGSAEEPFYTWRRGKHQTLPNGNMLLTEAEHGRLLEVSPAGEVIWTHDMVWDAESNLIVTEARHVPEDFFTAGVPSCETEVASQ